MIFSLALQLCSASELCVKGVMLNTCSAHCTHIDNMISTRHHSAEGEREQEQEKSQEQRRRKIKRKSLCDSFTSQCWESMSTMSYRGSRLPPRALFYLLSFLFIASCPYNVIPLILFFLCCLSKHISCKHNKVGKQLACLAMYSSIDSQVLNIWFTSNVCNVSGLEYLITQRAHCAFVLICSDIRGLSPHTHLQLDATVGTFTAKSPATSVIIWYDIILFAFTM